jgi:hypothetical protein
LEDAQGARVGLQDQVQQLEAASKISSARLELLGEEHATSLDRIKEMVKMPLNISLIFLLIVPRNVSCSI